MWDLQKAFSLRTIIKIHRFEIIDGVKYVYCIKHASEGTIRVCGRSLTLASMCFLFLFVRKNIYTLFKSQSNMLQINILYWIKLVIIYITLTLTIHSKVCYCTWHWIHTFSLKGRKKLWTFFKFQSIVLTDVWVFFVSEKYSNLPTFDDITLFPFRFAWR